jgi:type IV secretory pathway component VirB8
VYTVTVACTSLYINYYTYDSLTKVERINTVSLFSPVSNFLANPFSHFQLIYQTDGRTDRQTHRAVVASAVQVCKHIRKQVKYIRHMNEAGRMTREEMGNQWVQPGS